MLTLIAPVLVALHPASQAVPPNPDWDCDDPQAQQEMNWCAGLDFAVADSDLNDQWAITAQAMKARDARRQDNPYARDTRPGYFDTLLEAQRAWLAFRDAHCRAEGYAARGGSLEPLLVSTCKTALTNARTEQLRALAEDAM